MVILLLIGNVNKVRCFCVVGENGYCNYIMGLLYFIDYIIKLKVFIFFKVGICIENF